MVFRERTQVNPEREGLLLGDDVVFKRTNNLLRASWKSIGLGLLAGLIPLLLLLAIFQNTNDPTKPPTNNLQQPVPFVPVKSEPIPANFNLKSPIPVPNGPPVLKSIRSSPNWQKISAKKFRLNNSSLPGIHTPTEFGTFPQPTFTQAGNRTIATYKLIITRGVITPDGFPQPAILVNGQSPGPEIRVKQNSILVVHVENHLDTPTTIHFHGIHQRKTFFMDGVPHVTQNVIKPGSSFTYTMNLWPQAGTYFYHAHVNLDILWLFGPLIIEDDPAIYSKYPAEYQYDDDRVFILNGVYHDSLDSMVERINGPVHNYPTFLHSITINGRAFSEWTNNITGTDLSSPTDLCYDITTVKQDLRYRFRFINAASDSILGCSVVGHKFVVIETDGIYIEPVNSDYIIISPGQRYSFIITMNLTNDNYFILCRYLEIPGPLNGVAIMNYYNASKPTEEMLQFYKQGPGYFPADRWISDSITPNRALNQTDYYPVPKTIDHQHVLDVYEAVWGQRHVYVINGHYYQDPTVPYYMQLQQGKNITEEPQVFELIEGQTVQFVFQNTRLGSICFSHPWHIHGHHFHIVGEGPDKYDPVVDAAKIQQDVDSGKNFAFRDLVTVWANQTIGAHVDGAMCGWAAVRFTAHNNGLWLAHCHVTPHLIMGKKFVIWEHGLEDPMLTTLMSAKYDVNAPGEPGGW